MALSGSRDFISTRDSIIEDAVLPLGIEDILNNSVELAKAVRALNVMVQHWHNKSVFLWTVSQNNVTLTASTNSYALSADVVCVLADGMFIRRSNIDYPVEQITQTEYDLIPEKTQEGQPFQAYIDYQLANLTMFLYPTPENSTDVLYWREMLRLQDFDSATDNPDFPVRWSYALITGLTAALSPNFGRSREETAQFTVIANAAFLEAKNSVTGGPGQMRIQPDLRS